MQEKLENGSWSPAEIRNGYSSIIFYYFDFTAKIDCCLKKVTKGVDKFDDTLEKVHNASKRKRKEKYVEDLKKKIKKLQPLQNQIKTWIATAEIKDKSVLVEKLKLIDYVIAF
jgi:hypothetical protein